MKCPWLFVALAPVLATACVSENGQLKPAFLEPSQPPPDKVGAEYHAHIDRLLARAAAVDDTIDSAVRLDGRPESAATAPNPCRNVDPRIIQPGPRLEQAKSACESAAQSALNQADPMAMSGSVSNVGLLASIAKTLASMPLQMKALKDAGTLWAYAPSQATLADYDWCLALAERVAARAQEQAKGAVLAIAAAREQAQAQALSAAAEQARRKAQMQAEQAGIQAAREACTTSPSTCKAKCDSANDPNFCVAWAWKLRDLKPPPLADERTYVKKACDAGNQTACGIVPMIDKDIQTAAAQLDELWSPVQTTADEIIQHAWIVEWARKTHREPEGVLQRMAAKITEHIHRDLCPVKLAFIAQTSQAEFNRRAADHCKNNPPVGSAAGNYYAGAETGQVVLTTQCQTVFPSRCP